MKTNFFLLIAALFSSSFISAQEQIVNSPEMADTFRSNGKIYVVITVITIVFVCLAVYLMLIDMRLKKAEKTNSQKS